MRLTTIALAVMLAGCSTLGHIDALVAGEPRRELHSAKPPEQLAACLIRNAEQRGPYYSGLQKVGETPGTIEVTIRSQSLLVAVARISAAQSGSTGGLWVREGIFRMEYFSDVLVKGC